jgi:hypothetical protein
MFELQELRKRIEEQDYQGALKIVDELEEMQGYFILIYPENKFSV